MINKNLSPWIWVPTVMTAVVVACFLSTSQIRGMRAAKNWIQQNSAAWERFKADDPSLERVHIYSSTAVMIIISGKTNDPDANKRIRSFIDTLEPPPVRLSVGVEVVSAEEWDFLQEWDKERRKAE